MSEQGDMYRMFMRHQRLLGSDRDAVVLAILTGEDGQLMGKPVRFTVEFPDGAPMGMTEDDFREWCGRRLAEIRADQKRLLAEAGPYERTDTP